MQMHVVPEDFQYIIEHATDGYMIADGEGKILYTNPAYIRMVSKDQQEMVGHYMQEYIEKGDMDHSSLLTAIDRRKPISIFSVIRNEFSINAYSIPLFDSVGNIEKVYTRVKDYTELENLKRQITDFEDIMERKELLGDAFYDIGPNIVAVSSQMRQVFALAGRLKDVDTTVIIRGESGVGKDVVAKYMHQFGKRKNREYIAINCGALTENLLETELFGYAPGTFTGADKNGKKGLFEAAEGGVLFLDEIGDISPALQVKLLRVLESKTITRVGDYRQIPVDVRIITATNKNLEQMVKQRQFREDTYYRLNVVSIPIPPLRQRRDDIVPLCLLYLHKYNRTYNLQRKIRKEATDILRAYDWPGNVRELKNVIERLVVTSAGDEIRAANLSFLWKPNEEAGFPQTDADGISIRLDHLIPLNDAISAMEKQLLMQAKTQYASTRKIAEMLGVDHTTIARKLKKYTL